MDYQEKDLVTGKKFVNKLWNASKFVFMNLGDYSGKKPKKLELIDEVFLGELNKIIESATKNFLDYEYSRVKLEVDGFFWKSFCDNYMEIVKNRIYNGQEEQKESAKYVLYNSLLSIVKMMAPITPFIAEEVYQVFFKGNEGDNSVHVSSWPVVFDMKSGKKKDNIWSKFIEVLEYVRKTKSEAKKSMKSEIILSLNKSD